MACRFAFAYERETASPLPCLHFEAHRHREVVAVSPVAVVFVAERFGMAVSLRGVLVNPAHRVNVARPALVVKQAGRDGDLIEDMPLFVVERTEFVGGLARLRKRFRQLRSRHWLEGKRQGGSHDVLWLRPDGAEMSEEDWHFPEGRFLAYVMAPLDRNGEPLLLVFNAAAEGIELTLPSWHGVGNWICLLDTASHAPLTEHDAGSPSDKLTAHAISIMAFAGQA